jgi:hypothetical protein
MRRLAIIFIVALSLIIATSAFAEPPKSSNALPPRPFVSVVYLPIIQKTASFQPRVFVVAYIGTENIPIDKLTIELISDLTRATTWHGYDPQSRSIPSLRYTLSISGVISLHENPPHTPSGQFDYAAVYDRFGLCTMIQNGQVDEIWIWEDGTGNALESVIVGSDWSAKWGRPVPNCGKTIVTLNFNYKRSIAMALHTYAHSVEHIIHYSPYAKGEACDFFASPFILPSDSPGPERIPPGCFDDKSLSAAYGFIARPMVENDGIAVCGDVHRPPNIIDDNDHSMDNAGSMVSVPSRCGDWQWGGERIQNIDCRAWQCEPCQVDSDCEERNLARYYIWWMQNIPGLGNNDRGRDGTLRPNWWTFRFM